MEPTLRVTASMVGRTAAPVLRKDPSPSVPAKAAPDPAVLWATAVWGTKAALETETPIGFFAPAGFLARPLTIWISMLDPAAKAAGSGLFGDN